MDLRTVLLTCYYGTFLVSSLLRTAMYAWPFDDANQPGYVVGMNLLS